MSKREIVINKIICGGFLAYFIILVLERIFALIFSIFKGGEFSLIDGGFYAISTYIFTLLSVAAALVFFIKPAIDMFKVIFTKNIYSLDEKQYFRILLPIIILLFAGMTHTGFTIPYLQFLAYAHLIASMIAKTVDVCLTNKEKRLDTIISVVYLTLFSMAIPVIYPTWSAAPLNVFIYLAEYSTVLLLVPTFGLMLLYFFKNDGVSKFHVLPLIAMVILSSLTIGLRWVEEINIFAFIFVILTVICFIVRYIIIASRKDKKVEEDSKN